MLTLALLIGMGKNTHRWGWRCYAYCLLTLLQTIAAVEDGTKEKSLAEDSLTKAVKILEEPRNIHIGDTLMPNEKNDSVSPIVTAFYMWSKDYRKGKEYQKILPGNDIKKIHFTIRKTFIIIHGFLSNGLEEWIQNLKDKLLSREECNVISVDWPAGNPKWRFSYYTAVGNVPFVGMDTAALLKDINLYKGLDMRSVHLVGHGLGAHAAGFCGKNTKTIGRISGLDPSGLEYHKTSSNLRLDKSDASYVDVIHTNGCDPGWSPWTDCFGINENLGHTDYWPNGGEHQPACHKTKKQHLGFQNENQLTSQHNRNSMALGGHLSGENGYAAAYSCDQEMAQIYFLESIDYNTDGTYFLARPCLTWRAYEGGLCPCGEYAQYMGYNSINGNNGVFYLSTNSQSPFAIPDASCPSTWSHKRYIIILLTSSTSAGVLVLLILGIAVYCGVRRCRRKDESQSGLVVETDEESNDYDSESALSI